MVDFMKLLVTGGSGFIGTHLIDLLLDKGYDMINVSDVAPKKASHLQFWRPCNLEDIERLRNLACKFKPDALIHLAAKSDVFGSNTETFTVNVITTRNILEIVREVTSIERLIVASTQLVHRPGHIPENDEDYEPVNTYAMSKVACEEIVRVSRIECCWTIIRPVYIWGPWYPDFRFPIWRLIKRGLYLFPGQKPGVRCYGYVGNTVRQIERLMNAPEEKVNGKVFYLGDRHLRSLDWINAFSIAIRGERVNTIPEIAGRMAALIGDSLSCFGIPFILNSHRLNNLIEDYYVPLEPTISLVGEPEITLEQGVNETVTWLKKRGVV